MFMDAHAKVNNGYMSTVQEILCTVEDVVSWKSNEMCLQDDNMND